MTNPLYKYLNGGKVYFESWLQELKSIGGFLAYDKARHHGERAWWREAVHIMAARKPKGNRRDWEEVISVSGHASRDPFPPVKSLCFLVSSNNTLLL